MLNLPSQLKTIDFSKNRPSIASLPQAYIKALSIYLSRNTSLSNELLVCFSEGNLEKLHQLIHALKGASGNLGMQPVFEQAALIEQNTEVDESAVAIMAELIEQSIADAQAIIDLNPLEQPSSGRHYLQVKSDLIQLLEKSALVSQELIDEFKVSAKAEKESTFIQQVSHTLESFDYDEALRLLKE